MVELRSKLYMGIGAGLAVITAVAYFAYATRSGLTKSDDEFEEIEESKQTQAQPALVKKRTLTEVQGEFKRGS